MELIVISESKIKLTLTSEEMSLYTGSTKEILSEIMDDVRNKCGCREMKGRIFIQMYPSREGGCEMFVTKLSEREKYKNTLTGENHVLTEYRKYIYGERGKVYIYSFDNMEHLLSCCRDLSQIKYHGSSTVYVDRDNREYYLVLEAETHIAGENLGKLKPSRTFYYIQEYCDNICRTDAVNTLAKFA